MSPVGRSDGTLGREGVGGGWVVEVGGTMSNGEKKEEERSQEISRERGVSILISCLLAGSCSLCLNLLPPACFSFASVAARASETTKRRKVSGRGGTDEGARTRTRTSRRAPLPCLNFISPRPLLPLPVHLRQSVPSTFGSRSEYDTVTTEKQRETSQGYSFFGGAKRRVYKQGLPIAIQHALSLCLSV